LLEDEVDFEVLANQDLDGSHVTAGIVRNKSSKLYSFHTEILYYDGRQQLIGVHPSIILDLYPGMEKAFFVLTAEDWSRAARVEVKVTNIITAEETALRPHFEFGNFSVYHHKHGTRVLGEVINRGDMQYSIGVLGVVFDEQGKAAKANIHAINDLRPGEMRMFAVNLLGEETDAADGRVYLESIISVEPAKAPANITFSNPTMIYRSDIDRTSVQCDIVNHDPWGYRNISLLIGVYDTGRLIRVMESYLVSIGPGETIAFDQMLFDGNLAGNAVSIHIGGDEQGGQTE